jgi:Tfp pilus assembly ATPase PilU
LHVYTADVSHIEAYLNELMERRATDLHIAAGSPPMIRIDGSLQPIDGSEPLTPEETTLIVDRLSALTTSTDSTRTASWTSRSRGATGPASGPTPTTSATRRRWRCG